MVWGRDPDGTGGGESGVVWAEEEKRRLSTLDVKFGRQRGVEMLVTFAVIQLTWETNSNALLTNRQTT